MQLTAISISVLIVGVAVVVQGAVLYQNPVSKSSYGSTYKEPVERQESYAADVDDNDDVNDEDQATYSYATSAPYKKKSKPPVYKATTTKKPYKAVYQTTDVYRDNYESYSTQAPYKKRKSYKTTMAAYEDDQQYQDSYTTRTPYKKKSYTTTTYAPYVQKSYQTTPSYEVEDTYKANAPRENYPKKQPALIIEIVAYDPKKKSQY